MSTHRPGGFSILPPVTKNLIIICSILALAKYVLMNRGIDLDDYLGLHYYKSNLFNPYQFVTYIFIHGNFSHLFFNMFALWMFGSVIENYWGPKKYLTFFLLTGLGAALTQLVIFYFTIAPQLNTFQLLIDQSQGDWTTLEALKNEKVAFLNSPGLTVVGASGSLFGLLLAFGMLFPNSYIYLYFFIPMKAKYFVAIYGLIELFSGISSSPDDNVAHFAHLGGMLFGFLLIMLWKTKK